MQQSVSRIERSRGRLVVGFDRGVDRGTLDGFIEMERSCCSFLTIGLRTEREHLVAEFSVTDNQRDGVLAEIARLLDPASQLTAVRPGRKTYGWLPVGLGAACLAACLAPGLLAIGSSGLALSAGAASILGGVALAIAVASLAYVVLRRLRKSGSDSGGCDC
jgi:hypothetical protein